MIPQLLGLLEQNWPRFDVTASRPQRLQAVCQTFSFDKAAALVYADQSTVPSLVVKLPRGRGRRSVAFERFNGEWVDYLENCDEQERLSLIYSRAPDSLRSTIPRPLGHLVVAGRPVGLEAYVRGRPMNGFFVGADLLSKDFINRFVVPTIGWLSEFQARLPVPDLPLDKRSIWLRSAFQRYARTFPIDPIERQLIARLEREVDNVAATVRPVVSHGQLGPENIFVDGRAIRVIDWEWATLGGVPGTDLFRFLMLYFFRARQLEQSIETDAAYVDAFHWLFWERGPQNDTVVRMLATYLRAVGMPPNCARLALATMLTEDAVRKYVALRQRIDRGAYWYPPRDGTFSPHQCQVQQQFHRALVRHFAQHYESLSLSGVQ